MKTWNQWLLVSAVVLAVHPMAAAPPDDARQPFAVVELFTSEGCSSCPPADQLLADIAHEAKQSGKHIFPLAFHVDYWNRLGWTDPFSLPESSKRQDAYARALGLERLYTPQMIVNGTREFVGSDRTRARKEIDAALARPARAEIELRVSPGTSGWKVAYTVKDAPHDATVQVALVESDLVSDVRRGENAGRKLSHMSVVREFRSLSLEGRTSGNVSLTAKTLRSARDGLVIVFVQDRNTLAILAASSYSLSSAD